MTAFNRNEARNSAEPMLPTMFRVTRTRRETQDTFTVDLAPPGQGVFHFLPGQFNMLYAFGTGESAISISGDAAEPGRLTHTIRVVGTNTRALYGLRKGGLIGVRGPFGSAWPVEQAQGSDIVFVAGGIGLAPLRPAIYQTLRERHKYGKVVLLYGARNPAEMLYNRALERWRGRFDMDVFVTVDRADRDWFGNVGVVTRLIDRAAFDPAAAVAMICGPEIMMRFAVMGLRERGVPEADIHVSMERNMKCAIGFCGHCQFGPAFICREGPVFPFDRIKLWFDTREI